MKQKEFLAQLDQKRIVDAIKRAEGETSGQIRVHIQPKGGADIHRLGEKTFERLGMTLTKRRNGVLLFVATEEQRFVILGDSGIHEKVPPNFWDSIVARLTTRFKNGQFTDGIVEAIEAAGEHLKAYFPHTAGDTDELSDDIDITET
jgi:uncharacterized membrane protein